jgi:hypothetical protein
MTRDEFVSLPLSLALGLLWDKSGGMREALEKIEAPKPPRPPKFDQPIYRKGGIMWASECNEETLRYWQNRYLESAEKGGEWAEKDEKRAKSLSFWIAWRRCEPNAVWSGERNREQVTASPPNAKPFVYERDQPRRDERPASTPPPAFDDNDSDSDDQLPF